MPKKTKGEPTPRQAMSARQVDRVEVEVKHAIRLLDGITRREESGSCWHPRRPLYRLARRLTRLLASVRRSERR